MSPASLNVTVQIPVYVRRESHHQPGQPLLTQVELAAAGAAGHSLSGVRVEGNAVTLLLRSYLLPLDGYCLDPTNPLRLANSAVTYLGVERAPTVVADFLPPILRKLDIYVGPKPTLNEADAVVKLATSIAAHYGGQSLRRSPSCRWPTGRCPRPGGAATGAADRGRRGPDAGVSLYGPGRSRPADHGAANELTNSDPADHQCHRPVRAGFQGGSRTAEVHPAIAGQRDHHPSARSARCQRSALNPRSASTWTRPGWPTGARCPRI
jgi:hypothetical protein